LKFWRKQRLNPLKEIKVERIYFARDNNIREDYNDSEDSKSSGRAEALRNSIKTRGLLYPIRVKELGEVTAEGHMYKASDGHRRLEAISSLVAAGVLNADTGASLEIVSCVVVAVDVEDTEDLIDQIAINTTQERLKPLEQARAMQQLLDEGKTMEEVKATFSIKSDLNIQQKLNLLEAPAKLQEGLEKGDIAFTAATELLRVNDPKAQEKLIDEAVDNKLSISDVKSAIATANEVAKATGGTAIKQTRQRKTKAGKVKEKRKNMRPPDDCIAQLKVIKSEKEVCEDPTSAAKLDGWVAALSWVLTPGAHTAVNDISPADEEEISKLLAESTVSAEDLAGVTEDGNTDSTDTGEAASGEPGEESPAESSDAGTGEEKAEEASGEDSLDIEDAELEALLEDG
jgi:ParB-like chromosome segregation protein Spo0J